MWHGKFTSDVISVQSLWYSLCERNGRKVCGLQWQRTRIVLKDKEMSEQRALIQEP